MKSYHAHHIEIQIAIKRLKAFPARHVLGIPKIEKLKIADFGRLIHAIFQIKRNRHIEGAQ